MSLSGLNSGLYQQFSRYAEITDKALVELNEDTNCIQENRKALGSLFIELDTLRQNNVSARLIWVLLTEEMQLEAKDITEVGQLLLKVETDDEKVIRVLEDLALALADEQDSIRLRQRRGIR